MTQSKDYSGEAADVGNAETEMDAQAVAAYLCRNPDFFNQHPDVLDAIALPARWSGDGVIDMQQYLINRNRAEMDELRDCAQDVIETSRSNMSTQTRTHAAVLALLAARVWPDIVHVVTHDWPLLLDVDVVSLAFEPFTRSNTSLSRAELNTLAAGDIDRIVGADQDLRLLREINDDETVFGSGAGLVRSAALIRMRPSTNLPAGLLALGARSATFRPGQGTELLGFLCRVLESCMTRGLEGSSAGMQEFGD